jgi:hypothetical protein
MFAAIARPAARRVIAARPTNVAHILRRQIHFENSGGQNMPFSTKDRKAFAIKYATFCVIGYSLPFIAVSIIIKPAA